MRIVSGIVMVAFAMMLLIGMLDWWGGCGEVWHDYAGRKFMGECVGTEWLRSYF